MMFNYLESAVSILKERKEDGTLPDFVKKADLGFLVNGCPDDTAMLHKSANTFPVFDKPSAWIAAAVFDKYKDSIQDTVIPELDAAVKQACSLYKIDRKSCTQPKKPQITKIAYYAIDETYDDKRIQRYPIHTKEATEQSATQFDLCCSNDMLSWRRKAALSIVKMAEDHGIVIPDTSKLMQYASHEVKSPEIIKNAIAARIAAAGEQWGPLYEEIPDALETTSPEKVAMALEVLDKAAGLQPYWNIKVDDPFLTILKAPVQAVKSADDETVIIAEADEVPPSMIMLGGKSVPLHVLYERPLDFYTDTLGEDISAELKDKDGELNEEMVGAILTSLPANDQTILLRSLNI